MIQPPSVGPRIGRHDDAHRVGGHRAAAPRRREALEQDRLGDRLERAAADALHDSGQRSACSRLVAAPHAAEASVKMHDAHEQEALAAEARR